MSESGSQARVGEVAGASELLERLGVGPEDAPQLLREHGGNVSAAARASGVARTTFRAWLERSRKAHRGVS